ncbi:methionine synthase [Actinomycetospora endophytica]|uniref:Methionine synthase n=1 Tax=Actinomycetospora endophytica TaxID=2291215 RepID=A0ABS8PJ61_9PSEU|nr:methionine synthase [Actinomycetospora endophytica]MCD2197019.1 methionine synthase [Actinomycetospora endophytica]
MSDPLSALVMPGPDGPDGVGGPVPSGVPDEPRRPEERATGLGSLPGTDHREAARTVVGELPDFPHVAELPERGVGADMIGRATALLVDLAVEVWPSGYRVTARPGTHHRRGVELLARDVDALDEMLGETGAAPRRVKAQVAGPWTLAAGVELRSGHRVLTDRGAVAEFTESLAEGLRGHVTELARRTGADVVVQLDEPTLPAVLAGSLPTPSGYGTVRAVPGAEARAALETVVRAAREAGAAGVVVHCCHPTPPLALLGATGADAVAVDLTALDRSSAVLDAVGELWDAPTELWLGVVPSTDPAGAPPAIEALARRPLDLADRLGFDRERLADRAVVTPACGLAGASPGWARTAMARSVELARAFADPPSSW